MGALWIAQGRISATVKVVLFIRGCETPRGARADP